MNSSEPLNPIRRAVGESVATIKKLVSPETKPDRPENNRILRYENLEDRRVLSVNGIEADPTQDTAYVTSDFEDSGYVFQEDAISHLKILVNGEIRTLTPTNNTLELVDGDHVEVIEIGFYSTETTGVFAAEGYVNKIGDLSSASLIDYNDGRFSGGERDAVANGAYGTIGGLANEWVVESGWDRMTINLMHYDVDSTEVGARFFAQLQVGQPDFEFDTEHLDTILDQEIMVGEAVTIPAKWLNNVAGNFHNYAEVDIYHSSDTEVIVWAGATVGNASVDNSIGGEFLNTRDSDPFSERWTPDAPGEYILKYYLDPEKIVNETNEENNQYEIRLTVNEKPAPIAVDDSFDAGQSLDVMENDISMAQPETIYANDFETDSLTWTTDPYGSDTATAGIWEATDAVGTSWNGVQLQLEEAAQGQQALVTGGLDDGTAGFDDVDGGVTSALSESIAVAESNAVLSFKYNFAHLNNASNKDYFRVTVVGEESTKVVLEERGEKEDRGGKWVDFSVDLSEFSGQSIQLLVEAADGKNSSLVEAGIDDVKIEIPAAPMIVNEFSQGEHGSVSLNADGTINYTPDDGFEGEDNFQYTLTDGESESNVATATVNVDLKDFDVESTAAGDEDSAIKLEISTEYDQVKIEGVPEDAVLSHGRSRCHGVYELQASELEGLTILPAENSDADFRLTVTPAENGVYDESRTETINVVINAVVDGGDFEFQDFGIVTGKSGKLPVSGGFFDLDGSESHLITLNGLPDFVSLSAGTFDGVAWMLEPSDLDGLQISADKVADTSDWESYDKKNVFKGFEIRFAIESTEENGIESTFESGTFELFTIQKIKK
jgi:VCBS repeat-containing protein